MNKKRGIYIHMPFCVRKCNYCAFLSFTADGSPRKRYTDALEKEIELRAEAERTGGTDRQTDTVYIGGGTPSVMDISSMSEMIKTLRRSFDIRSDAEFTLEVNPATLGRKEGVMLAKMQAYRFMGVNRLSMGVQSMDNDRLHYLGRIHTAENVVRDMEIIRRKGFENVNLDLMFSIPGETTEDAVSDLRKVLELAPEHISCYSLQIEEGTPFGRMAEAGELTEVTDEDDRKTYHEICRLLEEAGYEHYEISNFARKSEDEPEGPSPYRSKHNSLYWNMDEYIGIGLGASGYLNGVRYKNTSDLDEYFRLIDEGRLPMAEEHENTAFDNISEAVFTGLRRREGISYCEAVKNYLSTKDPDKAELADQDAEASFWQIFSGAKAEAYEYAERGLLLIDDKGMRLTEKGIDISNSIMSLFV